MNLFNSSIKWKIILGLILLHLSGLNAQVGGLVPFRDGEKWGVSNFERQVLVQPSYQSVTYEHGFYILESKNHANILNSSLDSIRIDKDLLFGKSRPSIDDILTIQKKGKIKVAILDENLKYIGDTSKFDYLQILSKLNYGYLATGRKNNYSTLVYFPKEELDSTIIIHGPTKGSYSKRGPLINSLTLSTYKESTTYEILDDSDSSSIDVSLRLYSHTEYGLEPDTFEDIGVKELESTSEELGFKREVSQKILMKYDSIDDHLLFYSALDDYGIIVFHGGKNKLVDKNDSTIIDYSDLKLTDELITDRFHYSGKTKLYILAHDNKGNTFIVDNLGMPCQKIKKQVFNMGGFGKTLPMFSIDNTDNTYHFFNGQLVLLPNDPVIFNNPITHKKTVAIPVVFQPPNTSDSITVLNCNFNHGKTQIHRRRQAQNRQRGFRTGSDQNLSQIRRLPCYVLLMAA